jgi:hypothetical protein
MLCFVSRRSGGELLMFDVACNTGRNVARLGVVPGEKGGGPPKARNTLAT